MRSIFLGIQYKLPRFLSKGTQVRGDVLCFFGNGGVTSSQWMKKFKFQVSGLWNIQKWTSSWLTDVFSQDKYFSLLSWFKSNLLSKIVLNQVTFGRNIANFWGRKEWLRFLFDHSSRNQSKIQMLTLIGLIQNWYNFLEVWSLKKAYVITILI